MSVSKPLYGQTGTSVSTFVWTDRNVCFNLCMDTQERLFQPLYGQTGMSVLLVVFLGLSRVVHYNGAIPSNGKSGDNFRANAKILTESVVNTAQPSDGYRAS